MTSCVSYAPGHQIHWIQARLSLRNDPEGTPVVLSDARGCYFDVTLPDGTRQTWWQHDPERVARVVAAAVEAGGARLCSPGPLLRVRQGRGWLVLYPSLAPDADRPVVRPASPCQDPPRSSGAWPDDPTAGREAHERPRVCPSCGKPTR